MKTLSRWYQSAPLWRVCLESGLLCGLFYFLLGRLTSEFFPSQLDSGFTFAGAVCGTLAALRLRVKGKKWWRFLAREFAASILLTVALVAGAYLGALAAGETESLILNSVNWGLLALLVSGGPGFLILRVAFMILGWWNRLRQRRLVWSVTHWLLVISAAGTGVLFVLAFIMVNPSGSLKFAIDSPSLFTRVMAYLLFTVFPSIALMAVLFGGAVFVLAPVFSGLSYLLARQVTGRLERLASAAGKLRGGDLSVRVKVEGQDELAQLQETFNQMADGLQQATADLQTERDRLARLLQTQRELEAGVAHELRTPVATVRGYAERGLEHWEEQSDEEQRRSLEVIERETLRLQRLIDDLFVLARTEVNALDLQLRSVDAGEVARRVAETAAPLAWQRGRVEVIAQPAANLPLVRVDEIRLEQIITNLVQNAVRYTPPGGIVLVGAEAGDGRVTLSVADSGAGIPDEELPLIWERYYHGQDSQGGAGLGLALVKELTGLMGGEVGVTSQAGEGSRFWVLFPEEQKPHELEH